MGVLRLFLALSVVNLHGRDLLGFPLLMADLAVQAFYMISGFYMALVLHEKYQPGKATYFDFISNRFLRIFPSYFLVLLSTILLILVFAWHYGRSIGPYILWSQNWAQFDWSTKFFLVLSHLGLFGQDAYPFLGLNGQGGLRFDPNWQANHNGFFYFPLIPQAWSLSLELYFYLVAPFLVRRSVPMLAMMIAASLTVRYVLALWLGWKGDPWLYRFFPSELALFLCGAAAYRVYRVVRDGRMRAQNWIGLGATGVATGAALLINRYPAGGAMSLNIGFVISILLVLPFLFKLTKNSKIDHYIGELSYPMYLCHMTVIWLFNAMPIQNGMGKSAGILSLTLFVSMVLYWGVDRNVDNFRHRKFSAAHTGERGAG
jgi:peptidoglycan/LPS O-acetylase OafA/YrhL